MAGFNRFKLIIGIIISFFAIFLMSHNVYAESAATASLQINYRNNSASNYQWSNDMFFGRQYGLSISYGSARVYQFKTPTITSGGSNASVHFETNIVASTDDVQYVFGYFVNLQQQGILGCSWENQPVTIATSSLNSAITEWSEVLNGVTYYNVTLTLYGDIALSGIPANNQGQLTCQVGSLDYAFYDNPTDNPDLLYFEQNPMTINWSNNINDALLQTQINQNNQIINNQNQNTQDILDNQNQNTQDILDNQNQNTQDIINSNQSCHQSVNIFNGLFELGIINGSNGQNVSNSSYIRSKDYIPVDELTSYTFSTPSSFITDVFVYEYKSDYSYNLTANKRVNIGSYITTNAGTAYIRFRPLPATTDISLKFQVQKGTSASVYEPYAEEVCKNINEQYYDEQRQADQNISNQSTSDIQGAENQTTTNLIGVISGFISAFSNINPTNCSLTLEFPNFAGGTRVVDICQGKEKAPRIIEVGSSLFLIGVFVPLAYLLIKMIYNEIRSWTNG